ncbi:MAG: segregation/condensation protein A [Elusimicrobiota bacterium]
MTQETMPPVGFEVHLDLYEGPLALLLHLIEKNNMNILDIPIADITHEYLGYLARVQRVETAVAGEFLLMATTLMQIKTRMLLPKPTGPGQPEDPRSELVNRLLLYQRFTKVARDLEEKARSMELYTFRPAPVFEGSDYRIAQTPVDLYKAFKRILEDFVQAGGDIRAIEVDAHPVEAKIERITKLLEQAGSVPLASIFSAENSRLGIIACFLAILELIKRREITALQQEAFGEIFISRMASN